jgi:hypothetical protein
VTIVSLVVASMLAAADSGAATQVAHATPSYQFGINTYATYGCQTTPTYASWATTQFTKFKSLKANSVAIAFPLYTDSTTSNNVYGKLDCVTYKYQTPPASLIGTLIDVAHGRGLKVLLRPLIDQSNLYAQGPASWRGVLAPTNVSTWFANYLTALRPYLQIAQSHHVEHFAIQTELNSLANLSNWTSAIALSRALYKGDMVWTMSLHSTKSKATRAGTSFAVDAYPAIAAPVSASVTTLTSKWNHLLTSDPVHYGIPSITKAVIDEVGIPAQNGLYYKPWLYGLPLSQYPFNQTVQAHWFSAACAFMKQHHMKGIYYWGPWLSRRNGALLTTPTASSADDIQPAAAQAIKTCF